MDLLRDKVDSCSCGDIRFQVLTQLVSLIVHPFRTACIISLGWVIRTLLSKYAANLKANKCRNPNDNTKKFEMDPGSRKTFDLSYYSLLLKRRGLFESNAALTS
jgi:hypothetical protein